MNIHMISLGCDKNLVDAEMMLGLTGERGYQYTDDEMKADIIIVNTCCFIEEAKEESIQTILEAVSLKEEGNLKALVVTGCMAQRYKEEILTEIPEVDGILGTGSFDKIADIIDDILGDKKISTTDKEFLDLERLPSINTKRRNSTGGWYSYLKIAEGCDKNCTYCIIPKLRGHYRSYPMEALLEQAKSLAADGIKELILVAQETTLYGTDIYGKKALPDLLKELCKIDGIEWIRILYCYPEEITDELIEVMASEDKICKYLDLPIQHASDKILRRMARRTRRKDLEEVIAKLRKRMPNITLRTTLITGFPGESQEDFEELKSFIETIRFDRLGVFTYSREEDTPAYDFEHQVEEEVKEARREEIMLLQQEISLENLQTKIGKTFKVLIEGKVADEDVYIGRSYMDIPGVDGYVFVNANTEYISGDFVDVRITGASEYDLIGEPV